MFKRNRPLNRKPRKKIVIKNIFKVNRPINKTHKQKVVMKKDIVRPINKKRKNIKKYLPDIIEKRYVFITVVIILLFSVIGFRLVKLQVIDNEKYNEKLTLSVEKTIEGTSTPRGRIYDRNNNLLVDNEAVKTIYYKKSSGIKTGDEIKLAYQVAENINVDYSKITDKIIKEFWYLNNKEEGLKKIAKEEWQKNTERKITNDELIELIYSRITEEELGSFNDIDKEAAYIYYLMNKGYSYAEKIIKNKDVTEEEYAYISENIDTLKGFNTKLDWERIYLYGDTFKTILGSVSSNSQGIPKELATYYLNNGYSLDDRVGISYLEYQYENYLKGTKAKYKVSKNNTYELVDSGSRGNDIVLTIDINLQKYLEELLSREVLNAKSEPNTEYYNRSFVVISDPNTGEILAMSGKQVRKDDNGKLYVVDYTPGVTTLPVTAGSVVKGASMLVGYKYGAIDIGTSMMDECIKIKDTPEKCSWKPLGYIDDVSALKFSSNSYQYKIAIKVGEGEYNYNESLNLNKDAFDKYKKMYADFGLGTKTGIDLPIESLGYSGTSTLPGHLLDYSIGQYDTYTPIQLSQYINTLANGGTRYKPYLLKKVYEPSKNNETFGDILYDASKVELGKVDVEQKYIDRVRYAFSQVVASGLGVGYMGNYTDSGGKTGTSQSFIDTNEDGKVDTETITTSFVGYSPSTNPKFTIVVVSPDISHNNNNITYQSLVTKRITASMVNKYYELNN